MKTNLYMELMKYAAVDEVCIDGVGMDISGYDCFWDLNVGVSDKCGTGMFRFLEI